jgi:hypothetical protein
LPPVAILPARRRIGAMRVLPNSWQLVQSEEGVKVQLEKKIFSIFVSDTINKEEKITSTFKIAKKRVKKLHT